MGHAREHILCHAFVHDIHVFAVGTFRFTSMDWVIGVCYESWLLYLSLEHH